MADPQFEEFGETSFTNQPDDDISDDISDGTLDGELNETLEVPNEVPEWADSGVPSVINKDELGNTEQTEALVERWRNERGELVANLQFHSSVNGDLWLRWGSKWLLLTYKSRTGDFLAPSTIQRYYGVDVAKALGVYESTNLNREAVTALQTAYGELGRVQDNAENVELQETVQVATDAKNATSTVIETVETSFGKNADPPLNLRELHALDKTLQTTRGELVNNLAKLTSLDERIAYEKNKLDKVDTGTLVIDLETKQRIEERLRELQDERASRLEAAESNREDLRSQISRIRETIRRVLHEDTTLAERVRTLFREQGITIASILTAIGMAVSTLVLALTGGGTPTPTPTPKPKPDKGGIREWVKKHLQSLGRVLAKLAGKAAGALPGIIGSIVSWLLNLLAKTAGWMAENLWAVVLAFGGLLLVAAREWI